MACVGIIFTKIPKKNIIFGYSIDLKRLSEHSGIRFDTSSLVPYFDVLLLIRIMKTSSLKNCSGTRQNLLKNSQKVCSYQGEALNVPTAL